LGENFEGFVCGGLGGLIGVIKVMNFLRRLGKVCMFFL
jgi:hypothetical protein